MSALAKYFLYIADPNLREAFKNQIKQAHHSHSPYYQDIIKSDRDKSSEFYSSNKELTNIPDVDIPVTAGITSIVTNVDGQGNKITQGHKLYELSDAVRKFKAGERADLSINTTKDLRDYFKEQGKHFCAGYLSQYGEVVVATKNINAPLLDWISNSFAKIAHKKYYKAALSTYLLEQYKGMIKS